MYSATWVARATMVNCPYSFHRSGRVRNYLVFATNLRIPAGRQTISEMMLDNYVNQNYLVTRPAPPEGRIAIVTARWRGWRWTLWRQVFCTGRNVRSVRRSRVVLAPRPWRYAGGVSAGNGGKKGRFPGESTYKS
jgi:hypothetical protein